MLYTLPTIPAGDPSLHFPTFDCDTPQDNVPDLPADDFIPAEWQKFMEDLT